MKYKIGQYVHVYGTIFGQKESPDGTEFFGYGELAKVVDTQWDNCIGVKFIKTPRRSVRSAIFGVTTEVHPKQCRLLKNQKKLKRKFK